MGFMMVDVDNTARRVNEMANHLQLRVANARAERKNE
jgi:hypothetical protein